MDMKFIIFWLIIHSRKFYLFTIKLYSYSIAQISYITNELKLYDFTIYKKLFLQIHGKLLINFMSQS